MKNKPNKHRFIPQPLTSRDRLNEIGSLLCVAVRRLVCREKEKFSKNSLDFSSKRSVTAVLTK
jgi:hypothetical protein